MGVHVFPILNPSPPPSPSHPSGSSQCTSPEDLVSCIEPGLVIYFTYDNIHASMLFSQIIPPSPFPTESQSLAFKRTHRCRNGKGVVLDRRIDRMLSPEGTKYQDRGGLSKFICRGKKNLSKKRKVCSVKMMGEIHLLLVKRPRSNCWGK